MIGCYECDLEIKLKLAFLLSLNIYKTEAQVVAGIYGNYFVEPLLWKYFDVLEFSVAIIIGILLWGSRSCSHLNFYGIQHL